MSTPHALPLGALPAGTHVGAPVEHEMAIAWHEVAPLQSVPAAQGRQPPLSQTAPASHVEPLVAVPTGMQVPCPEEEHVRTPVWQAAGAQEIPASQKPTPESCASVPESATEPSPPASLGAMPSEPGPSWPVIPESEASAPPSPAPWSVVASPAPPSSPGPEVKSPRSDEQPAAEARTTSTREAY
jgi:hypothetical protein